MLSLLAALLVLPLSPPLATDPAAGLLRTPGPSDRPGARSDWFYRQRAYPAGQIPLDARWNALQQRQQMRQARPLAAKAGATSLWRSVGPAGFNSNVAPSWGRMSGRVRSLAIDPGNADRLLLGTATGGVWLSLDGGQQWQPLTDAAPSLAIGAVAIDPSNPQVLYAGTGEGNGSYYSVGLLKSVDGGQNWQVLGASAFRRGSIASIAIDPADPNTVLVCALLGRLQDRDGGALGTSIGGIYRSTDGGQNFQRTALNFCRGLYVVPTDFNTMYHSASGVGDDNGLYRSTDAGRSWQRVNSVIQGSDVDRLAVGLSNDGQRVYVGGAQGGNVVIQISNDGGLNFGPPRITPAPGFDDFDPGNAFSYCESQCGYDNVIAVSPTDPNDVLFGGVGLYRSRDGGSSFVRIGENNTPAAPGPGPLHVDHHVLLFHPTIPGRLYNGNDGGIYRSGDGGASWESLSGTLATLQHYHLSLHPTDPNVVFTGNQDNGTTRRTTSDTWTEVAGGDGGFSAVDHGNPQIVYASTTELNILKSTNGGNSFFRAGFNFGNDPVQFIAPFVMDPLDARTLYAGTHRLWRTDNGGSSWAPISAPLITRSGESISDIAVAPSDTGVIYVVGSDGTVAKLVAGVASQLTQAPLPNRFATDVVVDPVDPTIVYVSYSGFNSSTPGSPGHVFRSTDGGASWINISDNLPDTPANALAIRPDQPNEIYVGTDAGMYISFTAGGSWARMDNGLPNAPISALAVNQSTNLLAAATYGRGVWVTEMGDVLPPGPLDEPSLLMAALPLPNPPNPNCSAGYFTAVIDDGPGPGVQPGIFGVAMELDPPGLRELSGGVNFGGLMDVSQVGFASVNLANQANENQRLNVNLLGRPSSNPGGSIPVRVTINRRTATTIDTVFQTDTTIDLQTPFQTSLIVAPGFYEALVAPLGFPAEAAGGAAEGEFFFSLTTGFVDRPGGGFQGGAIVGGYHAENPFGGVSAFAAICLGEQYTSSIRVLSAPTYGPSGAGDLRLRLLDTNQQTIYSVP
ncbi:MAG: hypothetical protein KDI37_09535 [Xanthomonadales bacterium]|nr:hypothetical protein [Xanthomonadales bacterium]